MRMLFLLFLMVSCQSVAKEALVKSCQHLQSATKATFVLFSKKELIELGKCTGVDLIKKGQMKALELACGEVTENKASPLGIASLSMVEAIQIGQCMGVINYIYDHYHGESVESNRNRTYQCRRDTIEAAEILSISESINTRDEARAKLCTKQRRGY
ncbi:MAG: hypothetical protein ACI8WB_003774 [Phenylobacterium sp.]|jgi:hypothetical protein